jgi:undecaprenyl diphosphate synthase
MIADHLSTAEVPDPDLIIRTSGEYRISNFLLWQLAYSELYITEQFWPDFRRDELYKAIDSYQSRDRRFGKINSSKHEKG